MHTRLSHPFQKLLLHLPYQDDIDLIQALVEVC